MPNDPASDTSRAPRKPPRMRERLPSGMAWLIPMALAAIAVVLAGMMGEGQNQLAPQAFTRLARLSRMLSDNWYLAGYEPREFPPFGHMLYWTLPIDAIVLVAAAPLALLIGWDAALPYAVGLMGPASYLMLIASLIWAVRPLGETTARPRKARKRGYGALVQLMAGLMALSVPATLALARPGIADATLLMAALWVLVIGTFFRIGSGRWKDRGAVTAGFFSGLLVWMSVSTIPALAVVWLAFGMHASARGGVALRQGMIAVSTMALTLMVGAIGDPGINPWAIDRISLTYLLMGIMGICAFAAPVFVRRRHPDWAAGAVGAFMVMSVALGAFFLMGWTGLLLANETVAGGYARALWWERLGALQPADALPLAIAFLGHALVGIMVAAALAMRGRPGGNGGTRLFWMLAVGVLAILMFIGAIHLPLGLYSELAGVMVLAVGLTVVWRTIRREVRRPFALPAFGGVVVIAVLAVPALASVFALDQDRPNVSVGVHQQCRIGDIAGDLQSLALRTGGRLILAPPRYGPEILHRTGLNIVSGPWFSNAPGLDLTYKIFVNDDADEAAELLAHARIDMILICPPAPGSAIMRADPQQQSLFYRLANGNPPAWAVPLSWPDDRQTEFRLFQLRLPDPDVPGSPAPGTP